MGYSTRIGCLPLNDEVSIESTYCFNCCPGCSNGNSSDCRVLDYFDDEVELLCDACGDDIMSKSTVDYYEELET